MSKPLEEVKKLTIGQLAALVHAIGGLVAVKAILSDKGLAKRVAEFISEAVKETQEVVESGVKEKVAGVFSAFVNYRRLSYWQFRDLFDVVEGWATRMRSKVIDACELVNRKPREVIFELVCFGCEMSADDALIELYKRGLRPAIFEELLAFSKAYPEEHTQEKGLVLALGTFFAGRRIYDTVPYLWEGALGERELVFHWLPNSLAFEGTVWNDKSRFLAVKK
jgi:hypothetical protein